MRRATPFLYGFAEFGINALEVFLRLHLLVFYSKEIGLSVGHAGLAISISILWDAVVDPWIGKLSDRWRERHGSRAYLVLVGACLTGVFVLGLFHPPEFLATTLEKWLYLLMLSLLVNTSFTLFSIPYSAMVGDFSQDRNERAYFIGWRIFFANAGALAGILVPGYYLVAGATDTYAQSSWVIAMIILVSAFIGTWRPPPPFEAKDSAPIFEHGSWRQAFQNQPFLVLLLSFVIVNIGLTINTSSALYFYRLRMNFSEKDIQTVLLLFFAVFSLSVPLWIYIGRKWGRKKSLCFGAFALGIHSVVIYPLLPPGNFLFAVLGASLIGGILVGSSVLLESTLTDVIDYAQVKTHRESFGFYFGFWKFAGKLSRAASLLITGYALEWANANFPDPDTPMRLTYIFGPIVGIFFILAGFTLLPFGLSEQKCAQVKRILTKRLHGS